MFIYKEGDTLKALYSVDQLLTYCFALQPVSSKGTLSIQLLDYNNPSSKDYAGSCCDCCGAFGWCPNDCDNFFRIFVTSYPYNIFNSLSPWSRWETFVLGEDSFDFPGYGQSVGSGLTNPLTYHFTGRWPVCCFVVYYFIDEVFIPYFLKQYY